MIKSTRISSICALLVLVLAAPGYAVAAGPSWSAPQLIANSDFEQLPPQVAASGYAIFGWQTESVSAAPSFTVATRAPGQAFSRPVTLSTSSGDPSGPGAAIAVANDGRAAAAYDQFSGGVSHLIVRAFKPGRGWSAGHEVTNTSDGLEGISLAMNGAGDAVLAWTVVSSNFGTVETARSTDAGVTWSSPATLNVSPAGGGADTRSFQHPLTAVDPQGDSWIVWLVVSGGSGADTVAHSRYVGTVATPGQPFSAPAVASDPSDFASNGALTVDPRGRATFAYEWSVQDIYAATERTASTGWDTPTQLSGGCGAAGIRPAVVSDAAGDASVYMLCADWDDHPIVSDRGPVGGWATTPNYVDANATFRSTDAQILAAETGGGRATVLVSPGPAAVANAYVRNPSTLAFTALPGFAPSAPGSSIGLDGFGLDANGDVLAAFHTGTSPATVSYYASYFDPTMPALRAAAVPAKPVAGLTVTFGVSAPTSLSGLNASSVKWTFSDGGHASGLTVKHSFKRTGRFTAAVSAVNLSGVPGSVTLHFTVVAPSNRFTILGVKVGRHGRLAISLKAPDAGKFVAVATHGHGAAYGRASKSVSKAGEVTLVIVPAKTSTGHFKVDLGITFTPKFGVARTKHRSLAV